jgi:SAM-dependent methyltransferase
MNITIEIAVICFSPSPSLQRVITALREQGVPDPAISVILSGGPARQTNAPLFSNAARLVLSPRPADITEARLLAAHNCNAQYLAFLDDDCIPCPGWYHTIATTLTKYPQCTMLFGPRTTATHSLGGRIRAIESSTSTKETLRRLNPTPVTDPPALVAGGNMVVLRQLILDRSSHLTRYRHRAFEDVALQLHCRHENHLTVFSPTMEVTHLDNLSGTGLLRKSWTSGQGLRLCQKEHPALAQISRWHAWRSWWPAGCAQLAGTVAVAAVLVGDRWQWWQTAALSGALTGTLACGAVGGSALFGALKPLRDLSLLLGYLAGDTPWTAYSNRTRPQTPSTVRDRNRYPVETRNNAVNTQFASGPRQQGPDRSGTLGEPDRARPRRDYFSGPECATWWTPDSRPEARGLAREAQVVSQFVRTRVGLGQTVVDVCCGPGRLARELRDLDLVGVDISPHMLQLASAHCARVVLGDAQALPLPSGSAAVVTCLQSLVHVDDPETVLRECYRLLAPGGWLVVSVDSSLAPLVRMRKTLKNLIRALTRSGRKRRQARRKFHSLLSPGRIRWSLHQTGFANITIQGVRRRHRFGPCLTWPTAALATYCLLSARKPERTASPTTR